MQPVLALIQTDVTKMMGAALIIHAEIDRCASPDVSVWGTYLLALSGEAACESESIEAGVRVQHERIRPERGDEAVPPTAFAAPYLPSLQPCIDAVPDLATRWRLVTN